MTDRNGLITRNWQQFFEALLRRIGGAGDVTLGESGEVTVTSNTALALSAQSAQDIDGIRSSLAFQRELAKTNAELVRLRDDLTLRFLNAMVTPVKPIKEFLLEVPRGTISGFVSVNKFGRSTDVDAAIDTDIWDRANATDGQTIWTAPTTARTHQIASSSASDDGNPTGVGLRTLRLYGLTDWSTKEVFEDVTMDGTTNVATVNQYVIIHRMQGLTWGASGPNVGTITATADTDATITAQINAGEGQTQMAIYGWPSTQSLYLLQFYLSSNSGSPAGARIDGKILVNPIPDQELVAFLTKSTVATIDDGTSHFSHIFIPYSRFDGPGIIKMQASSSSNNSDVSSGFDLILVDN